MPTCDKPAHAERIHALLQNPSAAAGSAIAASWIRSVRDHGLDPEDPTPPQHASNRQMRQGRERLAPLLRAAQPILDRLLDIVGGSGACVLLTDAEGILLERRGRASDDDIFREWGLWPGRIWSEALEGTNGIGTCIAEHRALTIHYDQHFLARNVPLTCSVMPLHDPEGQLAGCLDVSSCRQDADRGMIALIAAATADAARRIEVAHFRQHYAHARIMLIPDDSAGGDSGALLALDRDDLVIGANRAARRLHDISSEQIAAGFPAAALLRTEPGNAWDDAERGVLLRALASTGGNISAAARRLGISRATLHRKMTRLNLRA